MSLKKIRLGLLYFDLKSLFQVDTRLSFKSRLTLSGWTVFILVFPSTSD